MTTSAVNTLENLVTSGKFASRLEASLNRNFRNADRTNWYTDALEVEGIEAAERQLAEWVSRNHSDVFASSIESVARGAVALAKVQSDSLVNITNHSTNLYSRVSQSDPRHQFVVFNPQAPGCCNVQPKGYEWAVDNDLGLRAVILETGYTRDGSTAIMTLVLPTWARNDLPGQQNSMALVNFETNGYATGERAVISVLKGAGDDTGEDISDPRLGLEYLLGIAKPGGKLQVGGFLSGVNETLGFPGATGYLAAKLPKLGDYLVDLAEKLAAHQH